MNKKTPIGPVWFGTNSWRSLPRQLFRGENAHKRKQAELVRFYISDPSPELDEFLAQLD